MQKFIEVPTIEYGNVLIGINHILTIEIGEDNSTVIYIDNDNKRIVYTPLSYEEVKSKINAITGK